MRLAELCGLARTAEMARGVRVLLLFRHTAAAAEYAKAHGIAKEAVRERLAHKATGSEMRYGASIEERIGRRGRGGGDAGE